MNTIGMSDKWHINRHGQLTHETRRPRCIAFIIPSLTRCSMWEQVHQLYSDLGFTAGGIMDLASGLQFEDPLWILDLWFLALFCPSANWGFCSGLEMGSRSFLGPIWWISGLGAGCFLVWQPVAQLLFFLKPPVHLPRYTDKQKVTGTNSEIDSLLFCCQLPERMLEKGLVNGYGSLLAVVRGFYRYYVVPSKWTMGI